MPMSTATTPTLRVARGRFLPIDGFIMALAGTLAAATVVPCRGESAQVFHGLGTVVITSLFFLQGARLSRTSVVHGMTHWRLHAAIGVTTFVLFPSLGIALVGLVPHLLPRSLWLGVLFLCVLPSTVQSSIALTSIARGNVAVAICAATVSNVAGIVLAPLMFGALANLHGRGIDLKAVGSVALQLLLPFAVGHLLRPWIGGWAQCNRRILSITDRSSILIVVYTAFSAAVTRGIWRQIPPAMLVALALVLAFLLATVLLIVVFASRALGFGSADEAALVFCGLQKSIVSGVPIATALVSGATIGPIMLPIMLYHPMQLVLCTWIARFLSQRDGAEVLNVT
jgi:solute carrier family 10 (sodium/bile acid cotransporter), member 7